jgi:hypothetical protein
MIQMAPALGPLLLAGFAAALFGTAVWTGASVIRRRSARTPQRALAAVAAAYVLTLVGGGALSHDRRVPLGTLLCFDDWCATVTGVLVQPGATAGRQMVVATLRVSSAARRVTQRGSDPQVFFIDRAGAWHRAGLDGASRDLRSPIAPGESFQTAVSADLAAGISIAAIRLWEGAWIDDIVPFDEESPFHGKTYYAVEHLRVSAMP